MNAIAHASPLSAGGPQLDNRRVIAGLIDVLVVLAGALLIGLAAGLSGAEFASAGPALSAVITAWALYYYFACESGGGQTLGKRLMKIRVVRVDGRPAGMSEIAVRTVLRLIDGLFLYLVGLIVMLVTGERRGRLGDLAGGTMIVAADAVRVAPPPLVAPSVAGLRVTLPIREPEPVEPAAVEPEPVEPVAPEAERPPTELEDLARDVAAEPEPELEPLPPPVPVPVPLPAPRAQPEEAEDEPVVVNAVETVSAIDLVMAEEPKKPA